MTESASGRGGRPLLWLSWSCVALLFGGLAIGVALGGVMPLPYGPATAVQTYVRAQPVAVHVIATAAFASSVPLAIYAALAAGRLHPRGAIALTGGVLAAGSLGLTGLLGWTLSRPDVGTDPALARALYYLVFLVGGPGHLAALGLLVGGIAVPSLKLGLTPRTVARIGVAVAALAELSTSVLVWPPLAVLLPVARVAALVWLVVIGALLPRRNLDPV